jgi:hypothetical protein
MSFKFQIDYATQFLRTSTAAVPGGDIVYEVWGNGAYSTGAFHSLISRARTGLAADPDNPLELVSTTYYRVRRKGEP